MYSLAEFNADNTKLGCKQCLDNHVISFDLKKCTINTLIQNCDISNNDGLQCHRCSENFGIVV